MIKFGIDHPQADPLELSRRSGEMREEGAGFWANLVITGKGISHSRTAAAPGVQVHQERPRDLRRRAVARQASQVGRVGLATGPRFVTLLRSVVEANRSGEGLQR